MHRLLLAALVLIIPLLARSEDVTRYDLRVNDFTDLKVVDDINVVYRCNPDSAGHVVFYADPDRASSIILQPNGTKLEIQLSTEAVGHPDALPTVTVYSSALSQAENHGNGHLKLESLNPGEKIKLYLEGNGRLTARNISRDNVFAKHITGNGEIVLGGKADVLKIVSLGTGQVQADELSVRDARCRIVGTGSIGVNASESLTVSGAGSGTVYYLGNPARKNRTLGIKTLPFGE